MSAAPGEPIEGIAAGRASPPGAVEAGDGVAQIETPALVIDLDAMERNIERMASYARSHGVRLRPHAKTHKTAAIARLQIEAGAVGICVQKLSEAQALVDAGISDIFISNQIVAPHKLARLALLAQRATLAIAVDSIAGIDALAHALKTTPADIGVFVEVDVGQGRCGVPPAQAGSLARQVVSHGLRFAGLQAYHGGAQHLRTVAEREAAIHRSVAQARAAYAAVTGDGVACQLVSGAGTGSFMFEAASSLYGEIQPGSYVFMDRDYGLNQAVPGAPMFEQALFVKSQVISLAAAHAVVDAGHKSHAIDSGLPSVWGRDLEFRNGGDEAGILIKHRDPLPTLGETVWLVPGHCDPTVNLHDHVIAVRGGLESGRVEAVWTVDARGCLT
jgi:D-serine deaminase-like pyridoxal phosphate-dependent protein